MAGSGSGPGECWLTPPSSKDSCSQQSRRGPATTPALGAPRGRPDTERSSHGRGRVSGTGHSKQREKGRLSVLASSAC